MKMNLKCSFSLSLDLDVNNVFSCEFGIWGGGAMENLKKGCFF